MDGNYYIQAVSTLPKEPNSTLYANQTSSLVSFVRQSHPSPEVTLPLLLQPEQRTGLQAKRSRLSRLLPLVGLLKRIARIRNERIWAFGGWAGVRQLLFGDEMLRSAHFLRVRRASWRRHWPVVFCYASPEDPDADHCQEGEERLEQPAVDCAFRAIADVHADDILEDLADREEECCADEVG